MGAESLFEAASKGRHAQVRELLQRGVDANHADEKGRTAMHFAASGGRYIC